MPDNSARTTPAGSQRELRPAEIEKALMHLSAAAVEADFGMEDSGWEAGEPPNRNWWNYREALDSIRRAEQAFERAGRRG